MKYYILLVVSFAFGHLTAQQPSGSYNIIWNSQSKNSSESMPCGGGDIGMNVWVENGDVLIYVARSGNFSEDNALMKAGRIRLRLFPNPFDGKIFKQELHLQEGYVTIDGENNGVKGTVRIWTDVFSPVAHFEITANKKISVEAIYESWRYKDRLIIARENFGNSWKWAAPKNNVYKKDEISFGIGGVLFHHSNGERTIFDTTVTQQGLDSINDQLYNPLKNLIFGGVFRGKDFIPANDTEGDYNGTDFKGWKLKSKKPVKQYSITLILHTQQATNFGEWLQGLKRSLLRADDKDAFSKTQQWWKEFWNRSFIRINESDTSSVAWKVGRNFQLFRYILARNANSESPTKFNVP
jgi:hypothetical protein